MPASMTDMPGYMELLAPRLEGPKPELDSCMPGPCWSPDPVGALELDPDVDVEPRGPKEGLV